MYFFTKPFYLALACLLSPFFVLAQGNFKKGYVVTAQGDTLRGYIDYQELGGKEPRSLTFKTQQADKIKSEFTPETTKYVDIMGLVAYQSYQGRISMDATSLNEIPLVMDTTTQAGHIYLKVIQTGKNVSLFSYTDKIKTRFFLQKKAGKIQELGFKKYYFNHTHTVHTLKTYTGQLSAAAMEWQVSTPALQKQIESAPYKESALVAIVSQLNQLDPSKQHKQLEQQKNKARFFAGLGIDRSAFAVTGEHVLARNQDNKGSYGPKISLGMDMFMNKHTQQLFFRTELILHLAKADINSRLQEGQFDKSFHQTFLQPTASLAQQLVYNLSNQDNLKLNLGLGAALNFSAYFDNMYSVQYTYRPDNRLSSHHQDKDHHEFAPFWFSFPIRAGLILNQKTDISVLYAMPMALTRYIHYSFSRSSLQVGINYLFNRQ